MSHELIRFGCARQGEMLSSVSRLRMGFIAVD